MDCERGSSAEARRRTKRKTRTVAVGSVEQPLADRALAPRVIVVAVRLAIGIVIRRPDARAARSPRVVAADRRQEELPLRQGRVGDELEQLIRLLAQGLGRVTERVVLREGEHCQRRSARCQAYERTG